MARYSEAAYAAGRSLYGMDREQFREYRQANTQMRRVVREHGRRESQAWMFGLVLVGAGLFWIWKKKQ